MKKSSLSAIYSALKGIDFDTEILAELDKEIHKGDEAKAKSAEGYAVLHDIVMTALSMTSGAVTISELWSSIEDDASAQGFTKGKVQYGLTKLWCDEIVKIEGNPNTYRKA
jgi:hypothetical protein